jgi:hypothetical protein
MLSFRMHHTGACHVRILHAFHPYDRRVSVEGVKYLFTSMNGPLEVVGNGKDRDHKVGAKAVDDSTN